MQRFESFYSRLWTPDRICQERADDYRGSGWLQSLSPACSKPKVWLEPTLLREEREGKDRRQKAILPTSQPAELNTDFGQVLPSISWPLLNSLFRKQVAGWSDRTPDTREPSPGGIHGSLALHGTDVIGVLIPDFFVPPRRARERKGSNTKTPDRELSLYIRYLLQKRPKPCRASRTNGRVLRRDRP